MQKITKKEFIAKMYENENQDIYFVSVIVKSDETPEALLQKLIDEVQSWDEYKVDYVPLIKERWKLKSNLKIELKSKSIILNGSYLDLVGTFYHIPHRNILMNVTKGFIIVYINLKEKNETL